MDEPIFEIPESLDALRAELRRHLLRCDYPVLRAALSVIKCCEGLRQDKLKHDGRRPKNDSRKVRHNMGRALRGMRSGNDGCVVRCSATMDIGGLREQG